MTIGESAIPNTRYTIWNVDVYEGFTIGKSTIPNRCHRVWNNDAFELAKTEHSHPLGMVVSTHFRCGKGVKRGLKNGALPFNID